MDNELSSDDCASTQEVDEKERLISAIEARRRCLEENVALRSKLEARIEQLKMERSGTSAMGDNEALRAEVQRLQGKKAESKQEHENRKKELEASITKLRQECKALEQEL